jgi:hypothetical protein
MGIDKKLIDQLLTDRKNPRISSGRTVCSKKPLPRLIGVRYMSASQLKLPHYVYAASGAEDEGTPNAAVCVPSCCSSHRILDASTGAEPLPSWPFPDSQS